MLVLSCLLVLAAVVMYVVARGRSSSQLRLGAVLALLGGVLCSVVSTVYVVGAYEVGVPVMFGRVGAPMTSGVHVNLTRS